jgi:hypothetical protein
MKFRAKGWLSWGKWDVLFTEPAQIQRSMSGHRMISVGCWKNLHRRMSCYSNALVRLMPVHHRFLYPRFR